MSDGHGEWEFYVFFYDTFFLLSSYTVITRYSCGGYHSLKILPAARIHQLWRTKYKVWAKNKTKSRDLFVLTISAFGVLLQAIKYHIYAPVCTFTHTQWENIHKSRTNDSNAALTLKCGSLCRWVSVRVIFLMKRILDKNYKNNIWCKILYW